MRKVTNGRRALVSADAARVWLLLLRGAAHRDRGFARGHASGSGRRVASYKKYAYSHGGTPSSNRKVWWLCSKGHDWEATVCRRARGSGCPKCSGHQRSKETSFGGRYPALAAQWHPTKNESATPFDFAASSNKSVWWQCSVTPPHEWQSKIRSRALHPHLGCRKCARRKAAPHRLALDESHPALAAQWDFERNSPLTPSDVKATEHRKVFWKCPEYSDTCLARVHPKSNCVRDGVSILCRTSCISREFPTDAATRSRGTVASESQRHTNA